MPHEDRICLQVCQSKKEIYDVYKDECLRAKIRPISGSSFKRMWKRPYKNVIIPKVMPQITGNDVISVQ